MTPKCRVIIERLAIRLPQSTATEARGLARSIGQALGRQSWPAAASQARLSVAVSARRPGETAGLFARRVGQATLATTGQKGRRGCAG